MTDTLRPARDAAPRMLSYEDDRASYAPEVSERFNPVLAIVERWAREAPDDPALLSLDGSGGVVAADTALDLAVASRQAARALLGLGLGKGDRVLVLLPRVPAWYSAMLGAMRIGAVPVPSPNLLTSRDIAYRLRSAEAAAIVTDAGGAAKVDAITEELPALRHRLRWAPGAPPAGGWLDYATLTERAGDGATPLDPTGRDDPLVIFFTSGTVAYPKMVEQPQSYGLGHVATARFWHDLRPGDLHWTVSDTGWAKACWGGLFGQWHERATVVQVALGRPEADTILRILAERGITSFCAPPTLYRLLVQADLGRHDLSALRHCTSAGEPLNPEVIRIWRSGTGLTIYDGYGQSETTVLVANYRCLPVRPGSMGKPVPGYRVAVLDDGGGSVPAGTVGNVAVRAEPPPGRALHRLPRRPAGDARRVPGRLVLHRRQGGRRRRRLLLVRGPLRRRDHVVRLPDRAVRGRVGADRAPGRRGGGRRRPRRSSPNADRLRLRHPRSGLGAVRRARARAAGAHEGADRAVQVPPRGAFRRRAAKDGQRQDPPLRAA